MKTLFDKTKIGSIQMKNRFVRSSTWDKMADERGYVTEDLMQRYKELSSGGVALILSGITMVTEEKPYENVMSLENDSYIDGYKKLTDMVHSYNSKIVAQLAYGGSQGTYTGNREILGPSAVPEIGTGVVPKEMTVKDIQMLIKAFGDTAVRAKKAGFDGVQLHASHGYLLSQFLTPHHNRRKDEYGGSIENRARIIFEIYEEIRGRVGESYSILIKINSSDYIEGGLTFEDSSYVTRELSKMGIDAIEITGGIVHAELGPQRNQIHTSDKESYHRVHGTKVAEEVDVPVILVGGNKSLEVMGELLNTTDIEYFSLSRPLLRESDLINRWEEGDRAKSKCISCNQCYHEDGNTCIFIRREQKN
ncbi:oxidoreductase [Propionigenium maris DSM 9537]|uniref:Oxidoreductase n=1 Tax=Propionigenium maris DSM 9537 TaxID=1123000 RepID=A0A9W6GIK7_9FUSO|nr:NADH:flavin oxidoreductase [Propionigenium maris]GLI54554.1 oxidoreductase [Propionigenium maris DSM 9537]